MVQLGETYNTQEVATQSNKKVVVPDGTYKAIIVSSGFEKNRYDSSKPDCIVLNVVITEGEHRDKEFEMVLGWQDHTPINPNNPQFTGHRACLGKLGQAAKALNLPDFENTDVLHNKPLGIETMTKKAKDKQTGEPKPEWDESLVKAFVALPSLSAQAQPQSAAPSAVAPSQPAQAQAASGVPSWAAQEQSAF